MSIDWPALYTPSLPIAEIVLRGTIVYLFIFALFRVLRREAGGLGITDVLVVVLIADAAQNAMANEYTSITDGLILVSTIAFWDYLLDWIGYRVPVMARLLHPPPLLLIKDGRIQRRNLRREMISEDELMSQLREHGVERVDEVKKSCMEGDGRISVITKNK